MQNNRRYYCKKDQTTWDEGGTAESLIEASRRQLLRTVEYVLAKESEKYIAVQVNKFAIKNTAISVDDHRKRTSTVMEVMVVQNVIIMDMSAQDIHDKNPKSENLEAVKYGRERKMAKNKSTCSGENKL